LHKYLDQTRYNPGTVIWTSLCKHTVSSTHHPQINFLINEVEAGKLVFDLKLALKIDGLELKIQAGRIKALRLGSCVGSGELRLGELVITKQKSKKIEIGDAWNLGAGVSIQ